MGWLSKSKKADQEDKDNEAPVKEVADEEAPLPKKSKKEANSDEVEVEFTPMVRETSTSANNSKQPRQTSCCSLIWFLLVGLSFGLISILRRLACCGRPYKKMSEMSAIEYVAVALGMVGTLTAVYLLAWPDDLWPNSLATITTLTAVANTDYCASSNGSLVCLNSGHGAASSLSGNHNPVLLTLQVSTHKEGTSKDDEPAVVVESDEYENDTTAASNTAETDGAGDDAEPVVDLSFENFVVQDTTLTGTNQPGAFEVLTNNVFLNALVDADERPGVYYLYLHPRNGNWQIAEYSGKVDLVEQPSSTSAVDKAVPSDLVQLAGETIVSTTFSFSIVA